MAQSANNKTPSPSKRKAAGGLPVVPYVSPREHNLRYSTIHVTTLHDISGFWWHVPSACHCNSYSKDHNPNLAIQCIITLPCSIGCLIWAMKAFVSLIQYQSFIISINVFTTLQQWALVPRQCMRNIARYSYLCQMNSTHMYVTRMSIHFLIFLYSTEYLYMVAHGMQRSYCCPLLLNVWHVP